MLETQENMNNLQKLAGKDRIKTIELPKAYGPELLEERASCKPDAR